MKCEGSKAWYVHILESMASLTTNVVNYLDFRAARGLARCQVGSAA